MGKSQSCPRLPKRINKNNDQKTSREPRLLHVWHAWKELEGAEAHNYRNGNQAAPEQTSHADSGSGCFLDHQGAFTSGLASLHMTSSPQSKSDCANGGDATHITPAPGHGCGGKQCKHNCDSTEDCGMQIVEYSCAYNHW